MLKYYEKDRLIIDNSIDEYIVQNDFINSINKFINGIYTIGILKENMYEDKINEEVYLKIKRNSEDEVDIEINDVNQRYGIKAIIKEIENVIINFFKGRPYDLYVNKIEDEKYQKIKKYGEEGK